MTLAEGWYKDPYDRFEARWISAGRPTRLVRNGDLEASDDPPDGPLPTRFDPLDPVEVDTHGTDLSRAGSEDESMGAAASRGVGQSVPNF